MADTTNTFDASDTSAGFITTDASPAFIDDATFHADVAHLESLWRRIPVGGLDLPIIDVGEGAPTVFVPILEHLEFVYARQVPALSRSRRVILYRRREERQRFVGLEERAEELRGVLDVLRGAARLRSEASDGRVQGRSTHQLLCVPPMIPNEEEALEGRREV